MARLRTAVAHVGMAAQWMGRTARRLPGVAVVTRTGWWVLAGSLAALVVAWWAQWVELALAGLAGLLTMALCTLFTVGRTNVRVEIAVEQRRLLAGETTAATVRLTNLARGPLLPLSVQVAVGSVISDFDVPLLSANATFNRQLPIRARHRGVITVGPVTTVRGDPLDLLARTVKWTGVEEVFVHPPTVDINPLGSGLRHDLEGRTGAALTSSDLAFHTLRDYVPGDDRRYIHWRSSAKVSASTPGGKFLVRQFLETRRTHLLVIVDGDPAAYEDPADFEVAISAGASIAARAVRDKLDATILVSDHIAYGATVQQVLDTCARAQPSTAGLSALIDRAVGVAPQATAVYVVTGSVPNIVNLRRAGARIPPDIPTAVVRVDPAGRPGASAGGALTVLTLRELNGLRGLLEGSGV